MNKKIFFLIILAGQLIFSGGLTIAQSISKKPNVIFILADDLGYADLGCYGQKLIETPNIDLLAKEGMRFTQHYAGSSVCAPSRDVLMTGMHTGHSTIRGNFPFKTEGNLPIPDKSVTVAEVFKTKGYQTAMMGKWGLGGPGSTGGPTRQGFDYSLAYLDQREAHNYYIPYLWKNEQKFVLDGNSDGKKQVYSHDVFAADALRFIRENKSKPFFLYLPFTIPHDNYEVPSTDSYTDQPWTDAQKAYAAMITRMDGDIGKIMRLLKELNLDDNTVVFFASDNGPVPQMIKKFNSSGPFKGQKGDLYEGGLRVPLIARWPGRIAPGGTSDHVSGFLDFLPTAAELIGAKSGEVDGISYLPTLLGKKQADHDFMYWEFFNVKNGAPVLTQMSIRMGDWKAVKMNIDSKPDGPLELYNLNTDIGETKNVAAMHPDLIKKIQANMINARYDSEYFKK